MRIDGIMSSNTIGIFFTIGWKCFNTHGSIRENAISIGFKLHDSGLSSESVDVEVMQILWLTQMMHNLFQMLVNGYAVCCIVLDVFLQLLVDLIICQQLVNILIQCFFESLIGLLDRSYPIIKSKE
jgi:hypothetical protein